MQLNKLATMCGVALFLTISHFPKESHGSILRGNHMSQDISRQNDQRQLSAVLESMVVEFENSPVKGKNNAMERERVKRSMKEDIESGFKEFADKVAKLPDQLTGSLKKYFEERGVSLESVQKILNDIWNGVEKLIDEIKKAL